MIHVPLALQTQVLPAVDPIPLPAPAELFLGLMHLTFVLHFVAMFLTIGGGTVLVYCAFSRSEHAAGLRGFLARSLPITLSFTVTLGVAPLLFIQVLYGRIFFTTSILMGWWWLLGIAFLMAAYYGFYLFQLNHEKSVMVRRWAPVLSALLLLAVGLMFVMNLRLFYRFEEWKEIYETAGGLFLNIGFPQVVPAWLNFMLSATAAGGILAAIHALYKKNSDAEYAKWALRLGGAWFGFFMLVRVAQGFQLLAVYPADLWSGSALAAISFYGGAALGVVAASIMLWAGIKGINGWPVVAAASLAVLDIVMIAVRRVSLRRHILQRLEGFDIDKMPVVPQWDLVAAFAVLLVAGLAIVLWMIAAVLKGRGVDVAEP